MFFVLWYDKFGGAHSFFGDTKKEALANLRAEWSNEDESKIKKADCAFFEAVEV